MIVKLNCFFCYLEYIYFVVIVGVIVFIEDGVIVRDCMYMDENYKFYFIDIFFVFLWWIVDDENFLEIYELFM